MLIYNFETVLGASTDLKMGFANGIILQTIVHINCWFKNKKCLCFVLEKKNQTCLFCASGMVDREFCILYLANAVVPVHVIHPVCCKVETLDLGVTRFESTGGEHRQLFLQANTFIIRAHQLHSEEFQTQQPVYIVHLLLLATFAGPVDLKLWKTDKTLRLLILNRKRN